MRHRRSTPPLFGGRIKLPPSLDVLCIIVILTLMYTFLLSFLLITPWYECTSTYKCTIIGVLFAGGGTLCPYLCQTWTPVAISISQPFHLPFTWSFVPFLGGVRPAAFDATSARCFSPSVATGSCSNEGIEFEGADATTISGFSMRACPEDHLFRFGAPSPTALRTSPRLCFRVFRGRRSFSASPSSSSSARPFFVDLFPSIASAFYEALFESVF